MDGAYPQDNLQSKDAKKLLSFIEDIKRQWMATVDSLVDPLMFVNQDYKIIKANKAFAQAAEHDIKDIVGKTCYKVFAKRKSPCPGCQLQSVYQKQEACYTELDSVIEDKFYEVNAQPIFDDQNKISGVVQVYRDRTEAKQLREQLLQSEKLSSIGLLAGGVAHEINNPLGGILIFSEMLLREMDPQSPHYQDVKEIHEAAQRCKSIVQSLLDFSRPGGHKKDNQTYFDLREALDSALRFAAVGYKNKKTKVSTKFPDKPLTVYANRNRIIQVFLNMVQNAYQAIPGKGLIEITGTYVTRSNDQEYCCVEIKDNGLGISKEQIKKIFDPFYTTKDPGQGTGLGLAICYSIIHDLGGEITVESEVNKGTTFRIYLPAAQKNINQQEKAS